LTSGARGLYSRMARILIVDDDAGIRRALGRIFERNGYSTAEAESGERALAMIGESAPDAIVCDVMMPAMSGLEFYDRLGPDHAPLRQRLVFLTGSSYLPAIHNTIERLGVPLLAKLNDLQLVVDAVHLVLLKPIAP
jgi:CheY-like chemotaxis protein